MPRNWPCVCHRYVAAKLTAFERAANAYAEAQKQTDPKQTSRGPRERREALLELQPEVEYFQKSFGLARSARAGPGTVTSKPWAPSARVWKT